MVYFKACTREPVETYRLVRVYDNEVDDEGNKVEYPSNEIQYVSSLEMPAYPADDVVGEPILLTQEEELPPSDLEITADAA